MLEPVNKPAKALAELQGLTMSVVTGGAANAALAVPLIESEDTVVSCVNLTDGAEVPVNTITVGSQRAKGTLTVVTGITDNDKVVVNGKTYTFKKIPMNPSQNYAPGVVPIANPPVINDAATALSKAIASNDSGLRTSVNAAVVTVEARVEGTAGNAITLNVTQAGTHVTASGTTLTGGTAATGVKISSDTSGKKLLLTWFDKTK